MKIRIHLVTAKDVCRSYEVSDVKEAKSVAMNITKAKLVAVSFFDGEDIIQIECFPGLGKPKWAIDSIIASEANKEKNRKFLKKFLKSSYAE